MRKSWLYGIIIILLLCCFGVISLPFFNLNNCENPKESKLYLRLGIANVPIVIHTCEV